MFTDSNSENIKKPLFSRGNKFLIFIVVLLFLIILILIAFIIGVGYTNKNNTSNTITSQIILDRVTSQAILLTKTLYLDQKSTISVDQGSDWSNFLWGQKISAQALMKIDVGCDLNALSSDKIKVDNNNKSIIINLPSATVKNVTASSDIQVKTDSGILKLLLANDPNADYNLAFNQLKKDAEQTVNGEKKQLLQDATKDIQTILQNLLKDTGYQILVVVE